MLEPDFVRDFRQVAGFRNVLVHGYLEVDLDILRRLLHQGLGEFEAFAAQVETYLQTI